MNEESLFAEALQRRTAAERDAYLEEVCSGDPALRRDVQGLLKSHDTAGTFLNDPVPVQLAGASDLVTQVMPGFPAPIDSAPALLSASIPGYEILGELGRGGMAVVYKARQTRLGRVVALKMIRAGNMADDLELTRLHTEAEAVARLQHAGIVQIHETGIYNGLPYLSLEYVEGGSLSSKLKGTPLPPAPAARLTILLARAVQAAHENGILHRDLKPDNIFLLANNDADGVPIEDRDGNVSRYWPKIGDFGLAKKVESPTATAIVPVTRTGVIMGTPSYMAPEQAAGKNDELTPAVDVYALGAILYELLTGRPPFRSASALDTLLQVLHDDPVMPSELQPGTPHDLETICLKCLLKEPVRRYRTARELADDLQRYLDGLPIHARAVGRLERTWRWCKRNRAVAALVFAIFAVLFAGASVATYFAVRAEQNASRAASRQQDAEAARTRAELAEREKTDKLWEAYLAQARAGRWSGRPGRRFDSLDALIRAAGIRPSLELRNEAIACLALTDTRTGKVWDGMPAGSSAPALTATFDRYARSDDKGNVSVRRVEDDQEIVSLVGGGKPAAALRFSPNGRFLAAKYGGNQGLCLVWDLEQNDGLPRVRGSVHHYALTFSPDSQRIALGQANGSIEVTELATGHITFLTGPTQPHSLAFHPNGKLLAVSSLLLDEVQILETEADKVAVTLPYTAPTRGMAWRGDGQFFAAACANNRVVIWNMVAVPRLHGVLEGHEGPVTTVAFNHRGDLLASTAWDGTVRLWDPQRSKPIIQTLASVSCLHFSPDDGCLGLMVNGSRLGFWEVTNGPEYRALPLKTRRTDRRAGISPDGRVLADAEPDGTRLWDLDTGTDLAKLSARGTNSAVFHPDGKAVITTGAAGLQRWPINILPKDNRIEAAQSLSTQSFERLALSQNGRFLAAPKSTSAQCFVFDLDNPAHPIMLDGHAGLTYVAISPDGHWVATGTWHGTGVKIWDARAAKLIVELPITGSAAVAFSPDGKWLVTSTGAEYCFWESETWRLRRQITRDRAGDMPGAMAFTADGSLMALTITRNLIQLVDPATGEQLATLESPHMRNIDWLCLDSTGKRLVAISDELAEIWDLHLIRQRLAPMGLDWGPR
jgi:WD40 repeat protein/tRNA A-37 threonylcarbamoyl transferase component Bud32